MATEIGKKDVAAISAAIAVHLGKPSPTKKAPAAELQENLELLLEKITELERKVDRLNLGVEELREKVERIEKR